MKLEKIITLANAHVRIPFLALERSLRAVGCDLPLWVIPYNEERFELPQGSSWWELKELNAWLTSQGGRPHKRKYACLLEERYQFIDTDAIFLTNPESFLSPFEGFVTSCGHWHNPGETQTPETRAIFHKKSTVWQSRVFNTGQFACDQKLYTSFQSLKTTAEKPEHIDACLKNRFHEQPGLNLLVALSEAPITNITLPPYNIESTWAGDYGDHYERYWNNEAQKPYLIHWAGKKPDGSSAIDQLLFNFLTQEEKQSFIEQIRQELARQSYIRTIARKAKAAYKAFCETP
ncbi:MAG: hypothetical protein Tsb0018_09310 [Opitutales bacterium]